VLASSITAKRRRYNEPHAPIPIELDEPFGVELPRSSTRVSTRHHLSPSTPNANRSRDARSHYVEAETYRFTNGKLHISIPDRPEYTYNTVTEVEFRRRYTSGDKVLIFTNQSLLPGTVRMLAFHTDLYDIRVSEFACTR
jgi:hypothetical protein